MTKRRGSVVQHAMTLNRAPLELGLEKRSGGKTEICRRIERIRTQSRLLNGSGVPPRGDAEPGRLA